jgi:hypothetical protein
MQYIAQWVVKLEINNFEYRHPVPPAKKLVRQFVNDYTWKGDSTDYYAGYKHTMGLSELFFVVDHIIDILEIVAGE